MALLRPTPGPARRISPAYAVRRYRADEAVVLDVREQAEYGAGHALDAVPLPPRGLTAQVSLPQDIRGRPALCVCRSGNRSQQAAEILTAGGVTALNVTGGMRAWAHAGLPVHTDQAREGQVV
jgi:rhodanese-related sulfurtransferase